MFTVFLYAIYTSSSYNQMFDLFAIRNENGVVIPLFSHAGDLMVEKEILYFLINVVLRGNLMYASRFSVHQTKHKHII